MSSSVTLSAATRQNLLSLQDTASLLSTTQNRLSTGKKVNSALDNPVNFFTSQSLSARSGDLSSLLDGISNGIQTIQAANQGITSIQKLLDTAKSTANQALANKSTTSSGVPAAPAVLTANVGFQASTGASQTGTHDFSGTTNKTIFTLADGVTGHETTITLSNDTLKGSVTDTSKVSAQDIVTAINNQLSNAYAADKTTAAQVTASVTSDGRITFTSKAAGADAQVSLTNQTGSTVDIGFNTVANLTTAQTATGAAATDGSVATLSGEDGDLAAADGDNNLSGKDASFTIKLGDGPAKTITIDENITAATAGSPKASEIVTAINDQLQGDTGFKDQVKAKLVDNKIVLTTTGDGAGKNLTVNASGADFDIGFGKGTTVDDVTATASDAANKTRQSLAKQFNDLLTQITQQAQDASYNGVNLLSRSGSDPKENTLHIAFNEKNTSNLDITGVKFDAEGLGLSSVSGGFQTDAEINKALSALTDATSTLRAQSSTFGANLSVVQNRQDFSKNLINILDTGSSNLTSADLNEEAANSQALSTRNSLAISALSLANQAQQGVLQLLR